MPSLSRLALALVLPLLGACTVYTPAEYRFLEESRADSTRTNRAAVMSDVAPQASAPAPGHSERGSARSVNEVAPTFTPAAFNGEDQRSQKAAPAPAKRAGRSEG